MLMKPWALTPLLRVRVPTPAIGQKIHSMLWRLVKGTTQDRNIEEFEVSKVSTISRDSFIRSRHFSAPRKVSRHEIS